MQSKWIGNNSLIGNFLFYSTILFLNGFKSELETQLVRRQSIPLCFLDSNGFIFCILANLKIKWRTLSQKVTPGDEYVSSMRGKYSPWKSYISHVVKWYVKVVLKAPLFTWWISYSVLIREAKVELESRQKKSVLCHAIGKWSVTVILIIFFLEDASC